MGMDNGEWKENLTAFGSDGGAVMTGGEKWCVGTVKQDQSTKNCKGFWCGAHKLELAVLKSLEHYEEFIKLCERLQSLYKEYHYGPKAVRELMGLANALEEKVSRPLNVLGAWWLPYLESASKIPGRVGSTGGQGRATFSVRFLKSLKGLLFAHLSWDIVEEAAQLS